MRVVLSRKLFLPGGAVAQLGARLDGIEEVVGSNPIGSTKTDVIPSLVLAKRSFIAAISALAILYVGDYLSVRLRVIHPKPADPFESLTAPPRLSHPGKKRQDRIPN